MDNDRIEVKFKVNFYRSITRSTMLTRSLADNFPLSDEGILTVPEQQSPVIQ